MKSLIRMRQPVVQLQGNPNNQDDIDERSVDSNVGANHFRDGAHEAPNGAQTPELKTSKKNSRKQRKIKAAID